MIFKNYINGVFTDAASGDQMDVYEPATGKVYAKVVSSSVVDVDMAVRAADKAFDSWSTLPLAIRCNYLVKIAEAIESKAQHLAELESTDQVAL